MKLDYSLTTPQERNELVKQIIAENPDLDNRYLETLADYLIFCLEKEEKKEKKILTENRLATINKRETSYEGLVSQLENGEDGIYNLADEGNKQAIFHPKVSITKQDIEEMPELRQIREAISIWDSIAKKSTGKDAYVAKKAMIELRKDQYLVKESYKTPVALKTITKSRTYPQLVDTTHAFNSEGYPIPEGVSLLNPTVCQCILCNYSLLRKNCAGKYDEDTWYLLENFDTLRERALQQFPIYQLIVQCKIDGLQNQEIQELITQQFHLYHSVEYISSLWRNKIPKLIASAAEDEYLDYYYLNIEKGKYKKCNRCGQIKLAHNKYFSKNKTSKDGFYSICKDCRNRKKDVIFDGSAKKE